MQDASHFFEARSASVQLGVDNSLNWDTDMRQPLKRFVKQCELRYSDLDHYQVATR